MKKYSHKTIKSLISFVLCTSICILALNTVFASIGTVSALEVSAAPTEIEIRSKRLVELPRRTMPISRENARDYILSAVTRYSGKLQPEDIIKGSPPEGPEHLLRPVTRIEAIIMISRAFGRLPAPVGDLDRSGAPVPEFDDIPDWAEKDVENLSQARILLPSNEKNAQLR